MRQARRKFEQVKLTEVDEDEDEDDDEEDEEEDDDDDDDEKEQRSKASLKPAKEERGSGKGAAGDAVKKGAKKPKYAAPS